MKIAYACMEEDDDDEHFFDVDDCTQMDMNKRTEMIGDAPK
jgi:hypothetical protein